MKQLGDEIFQAASEIAAKLGLPQHYTHEIARECEDAALTEYRRLTKGDHEQRKTSLPAGCES